MHIFTRDIFLRILNELFQDCFDFGHFVFWQRPYDQRHHHESRHAQQQQQQHHRHPEQHHQQHQNTTQRQENFMVCEIFLLCWILFLVQVLPCYVFYIWMTRQHCIQPIFRVGGGGGSFMTRNHLSFQFVLSTILKLYWCICVLTWSWIVIHWLPLFGFLLNEAEVWYLVIPLTRYCVAFNGMALPPSPPPLLLYLSTH